MLGQNCWLHFQDDNKRGWSRTLNKGIHVATDWSK